MTEDKIIEITDIFEAPDGSVTGRIDLVELHKLNAEVRALISVRTKRAEPTEADIIDAMVAAAAEHFGIEPKPDDPATPKVRRCMDAVLARLRADGVVN